VGHGGDVAMKPAFEVIGMPKAGGILVVCDHASNHVPADIHLGIDDRLLTQHISWDIGVVGVAQYLVDLSDCAAFLATHSRLVTDLNRYPTDDSVIPISSDGVSIAGNDLTASERQARLARFFTPYHAALKTLLRDHRPDLILSVHSFTPRLETDPAASRPWHIGILYNEHEAPSLMAIDYLSGEGLNIGDQLPYSGKMLNATMNRHAEANEIPYVGIEIRQDLISDAEGQERFAALLAEMAQYIVEKLASNAAT
jgi:predicted N-formylglutamate amidohydrolase